MTDYETKDAQFDAIRDSIDDYFSDYEKFLRLDAGALYHRANWNVQGYYFDDWNDILIVRWKGNTWCGDTDHVLTIVDSEAFLSGDYSSTFYYNFDHILSYQGWRKLDGSYVTKEEWRETSFYLPSQPKFKEDLDAQIEQWRKDNPGKGYPLSWMI